MNDSDEVADRENHPRFVVKDILSKRLRQSRIEYYVVFDDVTPRPSCWIPFTNLCQVVDAIATYEYNAGNQKYKRDIVNQLQGQVVAPMLNSLQKMKIKQHIIKVRHSRKTKKQLHKEYQREKIKREKPESIIIESHRPQKKRVPFGDVEVISLDGSELGEDVRKEQVEKLIKCLKNSQERKLYFMVQWKANKQTGVRKQPDIFSSEQMIKLCPKLLADYLLQNYSV